MPATYALDAAPTYARAGLAYRMHAGFVGIPRVSLVVDPGEFTWVDLEQRGFVRFRERALLVPTARHMEAKLHDPRTIYFVLTDEKRAVAGHSFPAPHPQFWRDQIAATGGLLTIVCETTALAHAQGPHAVRRALAHARLAVLPLAGRSHP